MKNLNPVNLYYHHHTGLRELAHRLAGLAQQGSWCNSRKGFQVLQQFPFHAISKRVTVCYSAWPEAYFFLTLATCSAHRGHDRIAKVHINVNLWLGELAAQGVRLTLRIPVQITLCVSAPACAKSRCGSVGQPLLHAWWHHHFQPSCWIFS